MNSISEISAGGNSSIAVRNDGYAYAWGNNDNGQLGDGLSDNASMPMQLLSGAKNPYVTYFRDALYVDMATDHAVITTRDGEVYSWGANRNGQLGNGATSVKEFSPVQVVSANGNLDNVVYVSAAGSHSYAVNGNGDVYTWGTNANGQLGNETTGGYYSVATRVVAGETATLDGTTELTNITRVYAG